MIHDPEGLAWQAEAERRWEEAVRRAGEMGVSPISLYRAPEFPRWSAPSHVRREVLGRFVLDRESGVLHDVTRAGEECRIDGIGSATWIHFGHEVESAAPPDARPCPVCLPEE